MLMLSRRPGESIRIGDDIVITYISCRGRQMKIGIDAPESVIILREELIDKPDK